MDNDWLISEFHKAKVAPEKAVLQDFLAKHLNVEIGISLRANRWAAAEFWEKAGKTFDLNELIEKSEVITIGGDGGGLDDLLGMAVVGRLPSHADTELKEWWVWCHAWCHPIALERRKQDEPKYLDFQAAGDLTIAHRVGDDTAEFAEIASRILSVVS